MGRTRTNVRQRVAQQFGGRYFVSSTLNVDTSATVVGDTTRLGIFVDDGLIGFHYYHASASGSEPTDHIVSDNDQSDGTVTIFPGDTAIASGDSYEILPYSATEIHLAIDQALLMLYDEGVLVRKLWTHAVSGSPIYNADASYWTSSSALHGWTATTATLARTQTAANKWIGENVASLSGAAGVLTLDATWARFLTDFAQAACVFTL